MIKSLLNDSEYQSTSDEWVQCQAELDTSRKRLLTDSLISKITQLLREAKQLSTLVDKANILETLLDESGISTATNLGQAVANREEAHAQWSAAREVVRQLGFNPEQIQQSGIQRSLSLVAPFAGYVRSVHANLGQYVSA